MDDFTKTKDEGDLFGRRLTRKVSMHTLISYNDLRMNVKLCDASLILDNGEIFPVHRSILSGSSDYFRVLFTTTLHKREFTKINVGTINKSTMEAILQYIYMRQVEINYESVFEIIQTADYLCIDGLVEICQEFLIECIRPNNCVTVLQFADCYYFIPVVKTAYKYITKHFTTIAEKSNELMKLKKDEFRKIIENNRLNVKREEQVWDVILKWVDYHPARQKSDLMFILPKVRFGLMDTKYFLDNVKEHRYIKNRFDYEPYILDSLRFQMKRGKSLSKTTDSITPMLARPRYPSEVLIAIGGWSGGCSTSIMEAYDIKSDSWTQIFKEDPKGPRAYHGTVTIGHDIYVIGGFNSSECFNSCRKFNTTTKRWEEIAPMNCKRCYVSVAFLNGKIYAMGGYDGFQRLRSVEQYDLERNQWSIIAPMTSERSDACATVLNDQIYVVGGFNGQECMNTAEKYDVVEDRWTPIKSMQTRRSGVSCTTYRGALYAVGGFNGLTRMRSGEMYDPVTGLWNPVPEMTYPRSNFALCVLDETMYAIGGFDGVSPIAHMECYDGRTDEWCIKCSMHVLRSALSACVITDLEDIESYLSPNQNMLCEERQQNVDRRQYVINERDALLNDGGDISVTEDVRRRQNNSLNCMIF